jgi:hypothetical protein
MPDRCKQCERYEKSLKELRERRTNLWRRGELTDAAAEKLAAEEQQIAEELKKHQATQHGHHGQECKDCRSLGSTQEREC